MGKTNGTQEMFLGLLGVLCINNVNPKEGRKVSIGETYIYSNHIRSV